MKERINIEERKPVWIALSGFYLDTELQEADFRHIVSVIMQSPYSFDEVKQINKYEVFPVLQFNLLSPAGEWLGFDEEELANAITSALAGRTVFGKIKVEGLYVVFKWMCAGYWKKLEQIYKEATGR